DVMNRHRKAIYAMRREVLMQPDISKRIKLMINDEVHTLATAPQAAREGFDDVVRDVFAFDEPTLDRLFDTDTLQFEKALGAAAGEAYAAKEETFTAEILRKVERDIYLQILDTLWMQHLENMEHLKEGIHWMAVGQQDPLVEYRRQGQLLFDSLQLTLRHQVVLTLYHAEPLPADAIEKPAETELTRAARRSVENTNTITTAETEFEEADFAARGTAATSPHEQPKKHTQATRKKARKTERKRRAAGRKGNRK
ncbi:MAG TPA: preprotein translocase subunit SecA, partial [Candidatus Saccharimonadales bacterium]|nr:preprotein translocase subunit SecA [Candidatus Saccharimonadales bacterium]